MFPRRGVIDLPSRQINYFLQKGNRKKLVSGQTWSDDAELSLPGVLQGLVVLHARGDGGDEMSHPVVEFPGHAAPIRDHVGP